MTDSITPLLQRLQTAKRIAIFTHQRPDPDALGSQVAAARILKSFGATEIFLMQFTSVPPQYQFLLEGLDGIAEVASFDSEWAGSSGGAIDTILIVDTCTYSQLEPAMGFLKGEKSKVVAIDHHLSRDDIGPLIHADTHAAACVEILWELAKNAHITMDAKLAFPLMAGLVSDTGWFRFDSVKPRSHLMAADLTPFLDNSDLYSRLQQMETKPKLALMQRALAGITWSFDDRFACMILRQKDFHETGALQSQTEYLIDMPLIVKTVEVVALLTEMSEGKVRGSLRSKRAIDVNHICRQFSGGGHAKAAGCRFDASLENARSQLTQAVGAALAH